MLCNIPVYLLGAPFGSGCGVHPAKREALLAYTLARSKAHRVFAVAFFGDKRGIAKKELNPPHPWRGFKLNTVLLNIWISVIRAIHG